MTGQPKVTRPLADAKLARVSINRTVCDPDTGPEWRFGKRPFALGESSPTRKKPASAALVANRIHAKISHRAMAKVFPFSALPTADLVIDATFEGGTKGTPQTMFEANSFQALAIKAASHRGCEDRSTWLQHVKMEMLDRQMEINAATAPAKSGRHRHYAL
jgi:hypothetical protein